MVRYCLYIHFSALDSNGKPIQCDEVVAANSLLKLHHQSMELIQNAIQTVKVSTTTINNQTQNKSLYSNIENLNEALSFAAYNYFYNNAFDDGLENLKKISTNPGELLKPILQAVRDGDIAKVDDAITMANNMGLFNRYGHSIYTVQFHISLLILF